MCCRLDIFIDVIGVEIVSLFFGNIFYKIVDDIVVIDNVSDISEIVKICEGD